MNPVGKMSVEQLAGFVCQTLADAGIVVTLTGGSCVHIWSDGKYVSNDLDFIEEEAATPKELTQVLKQIGFGRHKDGRHFVHPDVEFLIEFPTGPLAIGNQRIERVLVRQTSAGQLRILSPTDCVKDRLVSFFHWGDRQALEQALSVGISQKINLSDVRRWANAEGMKEKFITFESQLQTRRRGAQKR